MESLYAKYLRERENFEIIEEDHGFITYFINGDECYIRDIFVAQEFRKTKVAFDLANQVTLLAKDAGCKYLTGTVFPKANGATESLITILRYGFKIASSTHEKIILMKEL